MPLRRAAGAIPEAVTPDSKFSNCAPGVNIGVSGKHTRGDVHVLAICPAIFRGATLFFVLGFGFIAVLGGLMGRGEEVFEWLHAMFVADARVFQGDASLAASNSQLVDMFWLGEQTPSRS